MRHSRISQSASELAQGLLVVDALELGAITGAIGHRENQQCLRRHERAYPLEKGCICALPVLGLAVGPLAVGAEAYVLDRRDQKAASNGPVGPCQSSSNVAWLSRLGCQ